MAVKTARSPPRMVACQQRKYSERGVEVQLFEKLIEYPDAERLVLENTPSAARGGDAARGGPWASRWPGPAGHGRFAALRQQRRGRVRRQERRRRGRTDFFGSWTRRRRDARPRRASVRARRSRSSPAASSPTGADAVVMVENTSGWGESFELKKAASPGQNIRERGPGHPRGGRHPARGDRGRGARDRARGHPGLRERCPSTAGPGSSCSPRGPSSSSRGRAGLLAG